MQKFEAEVEAPNIKEDRAGFAGMSALPDREAPDSDRVDTVDGTVAGLKGFLRTLVELTGQYDAARTAPVLELQFSDIVTVTSVVEGNCGGCLSVTAFLPCARNGSTSQQSRLCSPKTSASKHQAEILWDVDEGRYVFVREIPVGQLCDERDVMDAVLTTSELATAWYDMNFSIFAAPVSADS